MGAPYGNKNAAKKNKRWRDAVERYAAQNPEKLAKIAEKVFAMALDGDMMAVKEIGDRLDGKPVQQVDIGEHASMTEEYRELTDEELMAIANRALQQASNGQGTVQ